MNNKGFALIAAIIIMVLLSALGIFLVSSLSTDIHISQDTLKSTQALFLAEAGLQHVMYRLKNSFGYRNNPTPESGSLGKGSFSVDVSRNDDAYSLSSTGTVDDVERKIKQTVLLVPEVFKYALHADKEIDFEGSTGTITGHVSSRSKDGVSNYEGMTIDGMIIEKSDAMFETVDYSFYESEADYVYDVDFTFDPGEYTGVYFFKQNVTISGDVTINGSIICEGDALFNGDNITIARTSNFPAVLSVNAISIEQLDNINIAGFVRCTLELGGLGIRIFQCSNVEITGTLLSKKEIIIEECPSITITCDEAILLQPPPFFEVKGGPQDKIVVPQPDWHEST